MSLDLDRVKDIEDRTKLIVFGFLHDVFGDDIPDLILYFCLLFYASIPVFSKCSQSFDQFGDGKNTLKGKSEHFPLYYKSAFGRRWIDSMGTDVMQWNIKIHDDGEFGGGYFGFGIISNHHDLDPENDFDKKHSYSYWLTSGGLFRHDACTETAIDGIDKIVSCKDEINFIFDVKARQLAFYFNDEKSDIKVITNSVTIGEDIKYAFAICWSLSGVTCSITVNESNL